MTWSFCCWCAWPQWSQRVRSPTRTGTDPSQRRCSGEGALIPRGEVGWPPVRRKSIQIKRSGNPTLNHGSRNFRPFSNVTPCNILTKNTRQWRFTQRNLSGPQLIHFASQQSNPNSPHICKGLPPTRISLSYIGCRESDRICHPDREPKRERRKRTDNGSRLRFRMNPQIL